MAVPYDRSRVIRQSGSVLKASDCVTEKLSVVLLLFIVHDVSSLTCRHICVP